MTDEDSTCNKQEMLGLYDDSTIHHNNHPTDFFFFFFFKSELLLYVTDTLFSLPEQCSGKAIVLPQRRRPQMLKFLLMFLRLTFS